MPNSYTAVPGIIPGNLTVNGNVVATGTVTGTGGVTSGANANAAQFLETASGFNGHIVNMAGMGVAFGVNLNTDGAARSNLTKPAWALGFDPNTGISKHRLLNAAGNPMDVAARLNLLTDPAQHAHTGTVTEDTIYTKLIRGGIIGANGVLELHVQLRTTVQGATATLVRVNANGLFQITAASFTTVTNSDILVRLINQNSVALQHVYARNIASGANPLIADIARAIDFSVDQTITVTIQNGTSTDNQFLEFGSIDLVNSFGPV